MKIILSSLEDSELYVLSSKKIFDKNCTLYDSNYFTDENNNIRKIDKYVARADYYANGAIYEKNI